MVTPEFWADRPFSAYLQEISFHSMSLMESVYIPGTRLERVGIEQPAIDLYDLSKKIQYHVTRKEFEIANDLLKDLPSDRSQEMKKMFELD